MIGLDYDAEFLALARHGAPENVTFVRGDAYATGLPAASFDMVHARFLACTAGEPERLVAEAMRLVRPRRRGGNAGVRADHAQLLSAASGMDGAADGVNRLLPGETEDPIAEQLYRQLRRAGLADVQYRPCIVGVRSGDPWQDYLPATVESLRTRVLERGLIAPRAFDATLAACRAHLADPRRSSPASRLVQVWGRAPASRETLRGSRSGGSGRRARG